MSYRPLSVSQVIYDIKNSLEGAFKTVLVEGEVSNLSFSGSGHYYFSLKDESSIISCAVFRGQALRNPLLKQLKNGMVILIQGSLNVYARRGSFQIVGQKVLLKNKKGDLQEQFELLKKKFIGEGFFQLEKKKKIPEFPRRIGVVTALGGAALQDFLNILNRRSSFFHIIISPALVQGEGAAASIIQALERLRDMEGVDVVSLIRGGGSLEDLWCFNEERLIRYLDDYPIPLITGIGHQTDFTLCDYMADKRAETPSAAAELLSVAHIRYLQSFRYIRNELIGKMKMRLSGIQRKMSKNRPLAFISSIQKNFYLKEKRFYRVRAVLEEALPLKWERKSADLERSFEELGSLWESAYENREKRLRELSFFLEKLHPQKVLKRGYTYIEFDEKLISSKRSFSQIDIDQELNLYFYDGVEKVKKC